MSFLRRAWQYARGISPICADRAAGPRREPASDRVSFQCNICGAQCAANRDQLTREEPTCHRCGSTVRMRTVIRTLATELLGHTMTLPELPIRKDLRGIGLSDWDVYARELARIFDYTNTFYDMEPRLDIKNVDARLHGTADFLIATDVFEHVSPPIAPAFDNARALLKHGGVLLFSVPFALDDEDTREHFPDLYDFELVERKGVVKLVNRTRDGRMTEYTNLVFHGGGGLTLEMRLFTKRALLAELTRAGFDSITFHGEADPSYGIFWSGAYSLVLSARA